MPCLVFRKLGNNAKNVSISYVLTIDVLPCKVNILTKKKRLVINYETTAD